MPHRPVAVLIVLTLLVSGCAFCPTCGTDYVPPPPTDVELLKIARFLTGDFDSAAQVAEDAAFHHVTLGAARIWPRREGVWVYVERAAAGRADRPFVQRVHHLQRLDDARFAFTTYLLADEARWVGAQHEPDRFLAEPPAVLREKEGCGMVLTRENVYTYAGAVEAGSCPSELHGSSYATTALSLTPRRIEIWERGWDEDDAPVWGTPEPYVFRRVLK